MVQGSGFRVQGSWFRVQDVRCRFQWRASWGYPGDSGDDDDAGRTIGWCGIGAGHVGLVDPDLALPGEKQGLYSPKRLGFEV